jgi:Na+-transporting methylmalonyl-CoA/oxaloacetate decarboxylase gamma subunit
MIASFSFLCTESAEVAAGAGEFGIDWSVLAVVLLGVAALMFVIRGIGLLAAKSLPEPGAKPVAPKAAKAADGTALTVEAGVTDELVAVLSAAAAYTLGSPVRILEISAGKMASQRAWSQEGRREIYLSHRIR